MWKQQLIPAKAERQDGKDQKTAAMTGDIWRCYLLEIKGGLNDKMYSTNIVMFSAPVVILLR